MATEHQDIVREALEPLGFSVTPSRMCGGPMEMTITDESLDALKGKTIEVNGEGNVTIL